MRKEIIRKRIAQLREKMKREGMDAYIIPSGDDHGSEYVHPYFGCREFMSGFTGSAGTLVITEEDASLWTDSRYFLQAAEELEGSGIRLMKEGEKGTPTIPEFLKDLAPKNSVGFDGKVVMRSTIEQWKGIRWSWEKDLVGEIWEDRPTIVPAGIDAVSVNVTGRSVSEKLAQLRKNMEERRATHLLLTDLTEIAWLTNLRGKDIAHTPVFFAFALLSRSLTEEETGKPNIQLCLFVRERDRFAENREKGAYPELHEEECPLTLASYDDIEGELAALPKESRLLLDPGSTSIALWKAIPEGVTILREESPVAQAKAIKNEKEIISTVEAHRRDGLAMVRFLRWIKEAVLPGKGRKAITEISAAKKLEALRREQGATDLSFPTIAGYGPHGAIVHYEATQKTDATLEEEGFLLVDSGGQYPDGTTDITRTIALGPLTDEMKKVYTIVLKGHIALARAHWPAESMTGRDLDALARRPICDAGYDYGHGSGHGVGHLLSVHEGPQSISPRDREHRILPGMILTDEPGIYLEGKFGVRLENELLVEEVPSGIGFCPITFCPFEREAILVENLTPEEIGWIDHYHRMVYERLEPSLTEEERAWLRNEIRPLASSL